MQLTGYVLRRDDTNLYWNKIEWCKVPYVYAKSTHARNSAHYHCDRVGRVLVPYTILKATVETMDEEVLFSKWIGDES